MLYQGPSAIELTDPDQEPETAAPSFQLRRYETEPVMFKVITEMPSKEALQEIDEKLPPHLAEIIKATLENIYSHVTQRVPDENSDHFFHHPASTVYYETHHGVLIKGKDHSKKASSIVSEITHTIAEIDARLRNLSAQQVEIVTHFRNIFFVHVQAFNKALQQISPSKKDHLKKHQNHDIESVDIMPITPTKVKSVKRTYPATPSPTKPKTTPKKLSNADKDSIEYLRAHKSIRPIFLDFGSSESDSSRDFDSDSGRSCNSSCSSDDELADYMSITQEVSLEDELLQMMDKKLLFSSFSPGSSMLPTPSSSTSSVKPVQKSKKSILR